MPGSGTLVPPDVEDVVPPEVVVVVPPDVEVDVVVPPEVVVVPPEVVVPPDVVVPPEVLVPEHFLPQQPQFQVAWAGALNERAATATSEADRSVLRSIVVSLFGIEHWFTPFIASSVPVQQYQGSQWLTSLGERQPCQADRHLQGVISLAGEGPHRS
jgi:hypothetical protein